MVLFPFTERNVLNEMTSKKYPVAAHSNAKVWKLEGEHSILCVPVVLVEGKLDGRSW